MADFNPWDFIQWLMELSQMNVSNEEGKRLIDEKLKSFSPQERVILNKFRKQYLVEDHLGDGTVSLTLVDRARYFGASGFKAKR